MFKHPKARVTLDEKQVGTHTHSINPEPTLWRHHHRRLELALFLSLILHIMSMVSFEQPISMEFGARAPKPARIISLSLVHEQRTTNKHTARPEASNAVRMRQPQSAMRKPAPQTQQAARAPVQQEHVRRGQANANAVQKQNYISDVLTHIESYKYYPAAARRRGLTGAIRISFQILRNGQIAALSITGKPLILRRAAEQAIHDAAPMPTPPAEMGDIVPVSFVMQYKITP